MNFPGKRISLGLLLLAYFLSLGGHVALTRTVAWTTMIWNEHNAGASWREAVVVTFEGRRPCCLCRGLAAAETRRAPDAVFPADAREKLKSLPLALASFDLPPPTSLPIAAATDWLTPLSTRERPPVRPPRAA